MVSLFVFVTLALIPFTLAQSPSDGGVAIQIAAIKAHFNNAGIVPSMLATFSPSAVMSVTYGANVPPGTSLTQARQSCQPFAMIVIECGLS